MLSLTLGLLLASGVETIDVAPSIDDDTPRVIVYGYPVSTAALALRGQVAGEWAADIPLGFSVRVNDRTRLAVELQWMTLFARGAQRPAGWGFSVAAGGSFTLVRGLYVDARARFTLYHPVLFDFGCPPGRVCFQSNGPLDLGPGRTRAFLGELDIGYEWRFGRLYLSPAIGIGGGYAFDYLDPTHVGLLTPFSGRTRQFDRRDGFVWTLNLNLLRVGVAL